MAEISLLDSNRLSALLRDALSWDKSVSSLMVSAINGSILAYAFRDNTPSIKAMRTLSTTMTAAYTVASEDILVFEAQNTGAISVIAPVAEQLLLAVTGPEPAMPVSQSGPLDHDAGDEAAVSQDEQMDPGPENGDDEHKIIRNGLEVVNQELASILKEELSGLRWPEDI